MAGAGTAATGLAGCSGTTGGGTTTGEETTTGETTTGGGTTAGTSTATQPDQSIAGTEPVEPIYDQRAAWGFVPSDINANEFNPTGNYPQGEAGNYWAAHAYLRNRGQNLFWKGIAESLSIDGCSWEMTLKGEDAKWWNGDPVTADDAVVQNKLNIYMGGLTPDDPEAKPQPLEKTGKYSFKQTLDAPYNEDRMKLQASRNFTVRSGYWKSWLEKFQDATTDEERKSVRENLLDYSISPQEMVDEGLRAGLWIPQRWDPTQLVHRKHEGHFRAEKTNIEKVRIRLINQDQKYYQAVKENEVDTAGGSADNKINIPDNFKNPYTPQSENVIATRGKAVKINQRNKHLARIGVRRAIAYLLSPKKVATIARQGFGVPYPPVTQFTGLMEDEYAKSTFGQEWINKLIDYGAGQQPKKATQAMQNAGYSKEGNVWVGPDGDPAEGLRFISLNRGVTPLLAETISGWLDDFGIKTDYYTQGRGTFFQNINNKHNWDIKVYVMGHWKPLLGAKYLPGNAWGMDAYNRITRMQYPGTEGCQRAIPEIIFHYDDVPSIAPDDGKISPLYGHQMDPFQKLPTEPGVKEIQGEGQDFRPMLWKQKMSQAASQDEIVKLAKNWARWFNYQVPHVGLTTLNGQTFLDKEHFALHKNSNLYRMGLRREAGMGGLYGKPKTQ